MQSVYSSAQQWPFCLLQFNKDYLNGEINVRVCLSRGGKKEKKSARNLYKVYLQNFKHKSKFFKLRRNNLHENIFKWKSHKLNYREQKIIKHLVGSKQLSNNSA